MEFSDYMTMFLEEGREALERANGLVLALERSPDDIELVHDLFRTIHSFKGMAGTMGFEALAELAHGVESLLAAMRDGGIRVQPGLVDALLHALDGLEVLITGEGEAPDVKLLNAELALWQVHTRAVPAAEGPPPAAPECPDAAPQGDTRRYVVEVRIDEHCMIKSVRALMIHSALETVGTVSDVEPPLEDVEWLGPDEPMRLTVHSGADQAAIEAAMAEMSEVSSFSVTPCAEAPTVSLPPDRHGAVQEAIAEGARAVMVEVQLQPGSQMQDVRLAMATAALGAHGLAEPVSGPEHDRFRVLAVSPAEDAALEGCLADIAEVQAVRLTPVAPADVRKAAPPTSLSARVPQAGQAPARQAPAIRVGVDRLDGLMALVEELIAERERLVAVAEAIAHPALDAATDRLGDVAGRLRSATSELRLVQVNTLFKRFPRMVRDLSRDLGKPVQLAVVGGETEIDRHYGDELADVFAHLIRNAVDHGLESPRDRKAAGKPVEGTITLSARHEAGAVVIAVADDGRGIDLDRVRAKCGAPMSDAEALDRIFEPGFSTAAAATQVSGRGVGLDAVRDKVRALGGDLSMATRPQEGTTFTIRLPMRHAVVPAMLAGVGGEVYGVPMAAVEAVVPAADPAHELTLACGERVPVLRLRDRFGVPDAPAPGPGSVLVVRTPAQRVGLLVEQVIGEREVAIQPLSDAHGELPGLTGAAPLEDGRVAFLVDPAGL